VYLQRHKESNREKKKKVNKHLERRLEPSTTWSGALSRSARTVWYGTEWNGNGIIASQREEKGSKADGQIQSTRESKKATKQANSNPPTFMPRDVFQ
jgi:hypothetical protein